MGDGQGIVKCLTGAARLAAKDPRTACNLSLIQALAAPGKRCLLLASCSVRELSRMLWIVAQFNAPLLNGLQTASQGAIGSVRAHDVVYQKKEEWKKVPAYVSLFPRME